MDACTSRRQGNRQSSLGRLMTGLANFLPNNSRSWIRTGALAAICTLGTSLPLVAADSSGPNTALEDVLWVSQTKSLDRISMDDGTALVQIASGYDNIAVDTNRLLVWTYGNKQLNAFDFSGNAHYSSVINAPESENADLVVDTESGSVWLGVNKTLYWITPEGQIQATYTLPEKTVGLAYNPTGKAVWVATQKSVIAYNQQGQKTAQFVIELGKKEQLHAIATGVDDNGVLIATSSYVYALDAAGNHVWRINLGKAGHLAPDGNGGIWVSTQKSTYRIDSGSGAILFTLSPFDGKRTIDAIAAHPSNGSVWIGADRVLRHFGTNSLLIDEVAVKYSIRDLAAYAGATLPPDISIIKPVANSYVSTDRPVFSVVIDEGGVAWMRKR